MSNAFTKLDRINKVAKFSDNLEYLNPNQMGSFIDVAPATIRSWIRGHKIKPAIEEGNTILLHKSQVIDCIMLKNKFNTQVNSNLFLVPLNTADKSIMQSKKKELINNLKDIQGVKTMTYIDSFEAFKEDAYKYLSIDKNNIKNDEFNISLNSLILQDIVSRVREIVQSAIISKYRDDSSYIDCSFKELRDYLLGVASDEVIESIHSKTNDKLDTFLGSVAAKINSVLSEYNAKSLFEEEKISISDIYYSVVKTESDDNEVIKKYNETNQKTLQKLEKHPFDSSTDAYQSLVKSNIHAFIVSEISKKFNNLKENGFYSIIVFNSGEKNTNVEEEIYSGVFNNIWVLNDSEMPENISQAIKNAERMNNIKVRYQ